MTTIDGDRIDSEVESVDTHEGSPKSRPWLIAVPAAILVLLGIIWSGFWYWSTSKAEATMTAWRVRESGAGRTYDCATTSFGGYPFRFEVDCSEPSVDIRRTALTLRAHNLAAVAQIWDPTLVISEIAPPLTVAPLGGAPTATMNWTLAQASLRGMPGAPERLAIVIDKPSLAAAPSGGTLAEAEHMEFHGRFAAGSAQGHQALDLALDLRHATAPAAVAALGTFAPLASAGADLSVVATLHGLSDLTPRPLAEQLRDIQAANGRLEITNARLQQGDMIASATGALTLTARGTLSGDLRLTVVNVTRLIPMLGLDRMGVSQDTINRVASKLDKLLPGLSGMRSRDNGSTAGGDAASAAAAAALGGKPAELEGQGAVTLALRFDDGVAYIGPLKIGQVPPLY